MTAQNSIGIQIGKSYSKFDVMRSGNFKVYDFSEEFDHDGFLAEIYYSHSPHKIIKLRPSISYNRRGAIVERDYGIVGHDKFSLNYLGIGATVGFSPVNQITIHSGLHYSYLMYSCSYWGNGRVSKSNSSEDTFSDFDLGYKAGLTLNIFNVLVSANYYESLIPLWELDHSLFNSNAIEYRNRSIEVSIGYNLNLGKKKRELY